MLTRTQELGKKTLPGISKHKQSCSSLRMIWQNPSDFPFRFPSTQLNPGGRKKFLLNHAIILAWPIYYASSSRNLLRSLEGKMEKLFRDNFAALDRSASRRTRSPTLLPPSARAALSAVAFQRRPLGRRIASVKPALSPATISSYL